jgi:hypothetical protein
MSDGVVRPRPVLLLVCAAVLGDVTALAAHRTIADPWVDSRSSTPRFGYTPFHNLHADSLKLPNRNLKMSRGYPARVGTGCAGSPPGSRLIRVDPSATGDWIQCGRRIGSGRNFTFTCL